MSIASNIKQIQTRVSEAAARAGRDVSNIQIIAVTKYVGFEKMNEAIAAGLADIGENRVQDAVTKFPLLTGQVTRHLIGSLQTNKVKMALANFDLIHSVDRLELVEALAKEADKTNRQVRLLIQLNISGELTKHGLSPVDYPALLEKIRTYSSLIPCGLMTIGPIEDDPEQVRPIFRQLKQLFDDTAKLLMDNTNWRYLSMGMSQDYQVAVEEGANLLRIGTAIFKED